MRPTIFMRFNTRHDNVGDQLIFYYLYEEARRHGDVHLVSSCPKFMNLRPLRWRQALQVAIRDHFLGKKNIVFIAPPGARFNAPNSYSPPYLKTQAINFFWKLLKTRFLLLGVSFDPKMDLRDCRIFSFLGIRDNLSLAAAKHQQLSQADYCPDMAFLMPQNPKSFSQNLNALISFRSETPDVGNHDFRGDLEKALPAVFKSIAPIVKKFKAYHQVTEDFDFNSKIAQEYATAYSIEFVSQMPNVYDLSSYSKDCSIVISNRLHVLLPAMAAGALPIAVIASKHFKIHSIFETLGISDCLVFIDKGDTVISQINKILENAEFIVQRNNEVFLKQAELVRNIIKKLLN